MHRIERIELDLPDGTLPSLSQRFSAKTGIDPVQALSSQKTNQTNERVGGTDKSATAPGKRQA
jgi:hypothetical protein